MVCVENREDHSFMKQLSWEGYSKLKVHWTKLGAPQIVELNCDSLSGFRETEGGTFLPPAGE